MDGFTVENWKLKLARHPLEDSYSIDEKNKIFVVADGVTRDPAGHLPETGKFNLIGQLRFALKYPRPSPAKIAADICCRTIPEVLRDFRAENRNKGAIRTAFREANERIGNWNKKNIAEPDYLVNDLAGCVAAAASVYDGQVCLGYLTDAGVGIFDKDGVLKFQTDDEGPGKYHEFIWKDFRLKNLKWKNPEARKIIREKYRNNPTEENSFGVLNGEAAALYYIRTELEQLNSSDNLVLYTDGLESVLKSEEIKEFLKTSNTDGLKKLCQKSVKTEGSLIYCKEDEIKTSFKVVYESERQR